MWSSKYINKWSIGFFVVLVLVLSFNFLDRERAYADLPDEISFNQHIRPILSQNCYVCHGPDSSSRKANLRLDNFEDATGLLESGNKAIVPGKPGRSELIARLKSHESDMIMPPPKTKKEISPLQIAIIEKWISEGAEWEDHWSLIPIKKKIKTGIDQENISENIDFFIDQKLANNSLTPSTKADRTSLIRRTSFVITGLPPTLDEIEMFSDLNQEGAYERMVDYYLSSPHFGEHWARHWMDLVRYAEHMGHEFDFPISNAWEYRDYLIRAFNTDVPYDQFVTEHLAGDLMEEPRYSSDGLVNESVIATGYALLGEGKHSPVDVKQEEADKIENMIDVTSKTFLGLTVSCARCHDHKFDPIPTTDYYAMYGMFESSRIGPIQYRKVVNQEKLLKELDDINKDIFEIENEFLIENPSLISNEEKEEIQSFLVEKNESSEEAPFEYLGDFRNGSFNDWIPTGIAFGEKPKAFINAVSTEDKEQKTINLASSRYYGEGMQGILRSKNFIIEDTFLVAFARGNASTIRLVVDNFQLIQYPLYGGLEFQLDHNKLKKYVFDLSMLMGRKAYFEILPGKYQRHHYEISPQAFIEVAYVAKTNHPDNPIFKDSLEIELKFPDRIKDEKIVSLSNSRKEILEELHDSTFAISFSDGPAVLSSVFERGSIKNQTTEKVSHGPLSSFAYLADDFESTGSGRLDWAKSLTHKDNPLLSRVMVNRIWYYIFGRGIVETVDNFGLQGSMPSHPELLDYLAVSFQDNSWRVKSMIKQILLTDAFQRSTVALDENTDVDPENVYLHRYTPRRIEAESVRDGILRVAGTMESEMYGPPVPIYLTKFMNGRGRPGISGPLDGNGRRSVYGSIRRNFLPPLMLAFDMPIPFSTFGKRNVTNVPEQSLALMNSPFVHQQSEEWAGEIIEEGGQSLEERIEYVYLKAFSRLPTEEDIVIALDILEEYRVENGLSEQEALENKLMWTAYCHIIFNNKEFIYLL